LAMMPSPSTTRTMMAPKLRISKVAFSALSMPRHLRTDRTGSCQVFLLVNRGDRALLDFWTPRLPSVAGGLQREGITVRFGNHIPKRRPPAKSVLQGSRLRTRKIIPACARLREGSKDIQMGAIMFKRSSAKPATLAGIFARRRKLTAQFDEGDGPAIHKLGRAHDSVRLAIHLVQW